MGLEGDDTLQGGAGNDTLDGGDNGDIGDTASYADATSGVTVSLSLQDTAQDTIGAGTDTLTGIENLTGSAFNDTLAGNDSDNTIDGGAGTDTVSYADAADRRVRHPHRAGHRPGYRRRRYRHPRQHREPHRFGLRRHPRSAMTVTMCSAASPATTRCTAAPATIPWMAGRGTTAPAYAGRRYRRDRQPRDNAPPRTRSARESTLSSASRT